MAKKKKDITKDQNKGLKISQETKIKEDGRKCDYKQCRGPNKISHHPPIYNRSSSYSTMGKSPIVKYSSVLKENKTNNATRREVPKATSFLSIGITFLKTIGTYKLKYGFDHFTLSV